MELVKSAQRTNGNSPAIYRWVCIQHFKSSPRSGRQKSLEDMHSVARFAGLGELLGARLLKCWAIFGRPLRGLIQFFSSNYYFHSVDASGLPQELQKRPFGSFCTAPQDAHDAVRVLAPHEEQNAEPAVLAAPHVPQRPGIGGT